MASRSRTLTRLSTLLVWLGLGAAAVTGASGGCSSDDASGGSSSSGLPDGGTTATGTGGGGGAGGSGSGGGGIPGQTGRDVFAGIEAELVTECGACHQAQGAADAPFLAGPDRYESITAWPGIVVDPADHSTILTHPADVSHGGGQAPDMSQGLRPKVLAWLKKEVSELPSTEQDAGAYIPAFKPLTGGAFNTLYLDPLGPEFKNMSISFVATELGADPAAPTILQLDDLTVHPVGQAPLHVVHPLFTVYPPGSDGDPDPVDSLASVDQTFLLGGDLKLGVGQVILTNWHKDAYLGLAFELLEVEGGGGGDAGLSACNSIALFQSNVVPAMQYCADTCHGGLNQTAKDTMDLANLLAMPPDEACVQVRARITPGDPDSSQILLVTDPTKQVVHMYKFQGNLVKYNDFKAKVTPWIQAE
jgi:hypothetical protein